MVGYCSALRRWWWRKRQACATLDWRAARVRRTSKHVVVLGAMLALASALAWNAAAQEQENSAPNAAAAVAKDPAVERGQKQFQQSCGFCHGPDATGARGPDLVRSPLVAHDVKGNLIGEVIRNGRPEKGMPALPLAEDQVSDIAAFLHAKAAEALESASVPKVYAIEKLLTGNAAAGEAFFNGAGGCKNCHSSTGDLAKIASRYTPIDLQGRMLYPERREGQQRRAAIVTLPSGEIIKGRLVHADDFVIALRDESGWYHSFPRNRVKVEIHDDLAAHRELLGKLTQADVHNLFAYLETLK